MMERRRFMVAGSAALLSTGLALWFRANSKAPKEGPIPRAKNLVRDPKGILDLPEGFRYVVLSRAGDKMSDGLILPARPDAMGTFTLPGGRIALMRNHELDAGAFDLGAFSIGSVVPPEAYDPASAGGVTRMVLDGSARVISQNLVLVGTARNCAGGISPWGWLTCEENVQPGHGYVFLTSPNADRVRAPQRISNYGRFLHEAVAIDETRGAAYLTEDRKEGCLYRFLPDSAADPHGRGRLQALAIQGAPRFQLGQKLDAHARFEVRWVDVRPEAGEKDELRGEAQAAGAAVVCRGEGIVRTEDGFAFTCTEGGPIQGGQIFHLVPSEQGGTLELLAQSEDETTLNMPDNITITPWGDLLVCEDNRETTHLRLVTRQGEVMPFARNAMSRSEFAGVCFSPDGRTVFVNIQEDGLTLAIQGPFEKLSRT